MAQKTDNRSVGGRFEQEFAEFLDQHGFWCHVMQQNKSGQPADIIAVKGDYHCLIDCKEASTKKGFVLSRVEENQRLAMQKFLSRGNHGGWFAVKYPVAGVRMISMDSILTAEAKGMKAISEVVAGQFASAEEWTEVVSIMLMKERRSHDPVLQILRKLCDGERELVRKETD